MGYYLELSEITLDTYKQRLKSHYLIPSQEMLREDIDQRFTKLKRLGITTLEHLYLKLKTKKKAEQIAEKSKVPLDYILVLRRAVLSHLPKLRDLKDYPAIDDHLIEQMELLHLRTSKDLYDYLLVTPYDEIEEELGLQPPAADHLASLMDVTRLRYVSPLFATALVAAGYGSVKDIRYADQTTLYDDIIRTNRHQHIYKGNIGYKDIQFLIEDAELYETELRGL